MLRLILFALLLGAVGFVVTASLQPDEFRYTRSATMAATPEQVFGYINNQRKWQEWSPWARMDPNMKVTYDGPEEGTGSVASWDGNRDVGKGISTLTQNRRPEFVQFRLEFLEPMKATHTSEFTLTDNGNGQTTVSWSMYGRNNFVGKAVNLIFDCEKMVGEMFEQGLANLKQIVEALPAPAPAPKAAPAGEYLPMDSDAAIRSAD